MGYNLLHGHSVRRRFFVERFAGNAAVLRGAAAHHLGRVLRARPGQLYELSDGQAVWLARTERVTRDAVEFTLVEPLPAVRSNEHLTLLLSIVKFERFEWSLEKATELGAAEIAPLVAARSEKALVSAAAKRATRWSRILLEASEQSRRLRPPVLRPAVRPRDAFRDASTDTKILLSERPGASSLRAVLEGKQTESVALAIGPEGGWTEEEFAQAQQANFVEASLGSNILRTETAVVAALAVVNYVLTE